MFDNIIVFQHFGNQLDMKAKKVQAGSQLSHISTNEKIKRFLKYFVSNQPPGFLVHFP